MNRTTILMILALVVAALAATSASAASGRTLRLVSVQQNFAMVPQGAPTLGSTMIFTDTIYNGAAQFGKKTGARIGTSEGVCTIVSRSKAQCTITAHLPNGELVVSGAMLVSERDLTRTTYAITGGAGAYAGARGIAAAHDLSPTRSLIELRLL